MFGIAGLTVDIFAVFSIIFLSVVMFLVEMVRVDVSAWVVLMLLGITKLLPPDLLFSGFASDSVVSIIGVMIIAAGLERSGMIQKLSQMIIVLGHDQHRRLSLLLMITSGVLAGFMRSVGAVALLLPVITRIAKRTGLSKSRFLLPVGFCAVLGSTLTMVGTGPLILLNNLLVNADGLKDMHGNAMPPFGLFFVLPIGVALLLLGILYFLFLGRWFFPPRQGRALSNRNTLDYFKKTYEVGGELLEMEVLPESPWTEWSLRDLEDRLDPCLVVVGIKMGNTVHFPALRKMTLRAGVVIAMLGDRNLLQDLAHRDHLILKTGLEEFAELLHPSQSGPCEVVIPPSSEWVGRQMRELHMRREYKVQIMAVHRGPKVLRGQEMMELLLHPGDTLGLFSSWAVLQQLEKEPDLVVITPDYPKEDPYTGREVTALSFLILTLLLIVFGLVPLSIALMVGAVGMVCSGVLTIDEAYTAVSWKTIFLLAGLIPLGIAMQSSGAATWLTEHLLRMMSQWPLVAVQWSIGILAMLLGLVMSNVGATVLLVPVAVELAKYLGADPRFFAFIVALGASNVFLMPSHQANALIAGPGRYTAYDFLRSGSLITILYLVVMLWVLPFLF